MPSPLPLTTCTSKEIWFWGPENRRAGPVPHWLKGLRRAGTVPHLGNTIVLLALVVGEQVSQPRVSMQENWLPY